MGRNEWEDLGDRIADIIDTAVRSQDFQKLNESITEVVENSIEFGSDTIKSVVKGATQREAYKRYRYTPPSSFQNKAPKIKPKVLYGQTTGERVAGVLGMIFGGVVTVSSAGMLLAVSLATELQSTGSLVGAAVLAAVTAGGAYLAYSGGRLVAQTTRFRRYVRALGDRTYVNIEELSKMIGKPVKFVQKDVKQMIHRGWFVEGHTDQEEKVLITSNETYQQYEDTMKELEARRQSEASKPQVNAEVQEILKKGRNYLDKIHKSNEEIPGEEISVKISRMEELVQRIFERVQEHPESADELNKLMNYYLPMTVKLLDVYEELDRQPIQGDNIRKSKLEIEETMDTLNAAFEKLLDSIFQETALDVTSDISVLNTLLAQEGLTEDEITTYSRGM